MWEIRAPQNLRGKVDGPIYRPNGYGPHSRVDSASMENRGSASVRRAALRLRLHPHQRIGA